MADGREPRPHLAQRAGRSPLLARKRLHIFFQPRIAAYGRPQLDAFADAMLALLGETIRAVAAATGPHYAALSNEQERTADKPPAERSQDMRRRGP